MRSFLPPCGDKLQFSNNIIDSKIMRLSSPCGDKLQSRKYIVYVDRNELSSPCGDKLQFPDIEDLKKLGRIIVPLRG